MFNEQRLCETYLQYLVDFKVLDEEQALRVLAAQKKGTPPIGKLALLQSLLSMKQVARVLAAQADMGMLFGEVAIALGYLQLTEVRGLLEKQRQARPQVNAIILEMGLATDEQLKALRADFLSSMAEIVA